MGSTYRRGRIWWIKYYQCGTQFRETSKSNKLRDAKRLLKSRESEISTGGLLEPGPGRVRFETLAEDFLSDYRVNQRKSLAWAKRRIERHLAPFFARLRPAEITSDKVREFTAKRQRQGASNASINRELSVLKRMFNLGAETTPPKVARVPHIPMLKECNVRQGFFEHDEYLALHGELAAHLQPLLAFGYYTGARRGEILGLKWRQVDLESHVVQLDPGSTKNEQARTIPVAGALLKLLKARKTACDRCLPQCEYVFCQNGEPIGSFYVAWNSACRRAGVAGKIFHDLRRTAVRNMIRAGVPERVAMAISGHKTRSVFDRYNIVAERDLHEAADRLDVYLSRFGCRRSTARPRTHRRNSS